MSNEDRREETIHRPGGILENEHYETIIHDRKSGKEARAKGDSEEESIEKAYKKYREKYK